MKRSERGFTLIELLVVLAIVALIAGAATMATFQVINVTKSSNDRMTAVRQVQNAGFWISHDTLMAQGITVDDDPETADFLILTWTNWKEDGEEDDEVHKIIYTFHNMADGLKQLKRQYLIYNADSVEIGNETTLVAQYIYIDLTSFEEQDDIWKLTIQARSGTETETREYEINPRVNI